MFDWAGTVCDAGVFAPVLTFQKLFEDEGVPITSAEVRAPMGVHKRVMNTKIEAAIAVKYYLFSASHPENLSAARGQEEMDG